MSSLNAPTTAAATEDFRRRKSSVVAYTDAVGQRQTVAIDQLESEADRALAAEFGYKPVFKREFGYLSTFSFAVSISGLFSTVATTFSFPLVAGGSASAVWCWLISGSGCMCIALSVAELVSAYPTCGGL
jgi:amino acid permease